VPEADGYDPARGPIRQEPLFRFAPLFLAPHDGVPLGMARRAIDVVIALAEAKGVPAFGSREPPTLRDTVQVQEAVARAEAELGGARALCYVPWPICGRRCWRASAPAPVSAACTARP
jgi:alkylation response protein AidB-like acyl-CoA dehydrogenase